MIKLGFKIVGDEKMQIICMLIFLSSLLLFFLFTAISFMFNIDIYISTLPSFLQPLPLSLIVACVFYPIVTYVNLLRYKGTFFLYVDKIQLIIEKSQYAFSPFEPTVLSNIILPIESIEQIDIMYLGFESLSTTGIRYEKKSGNYNTIFIQTKNGKNYQYNFFSDEKRDRKRIVSYIICWKRNYNVAIKWGSQVIEEKDLDRLEEYAYF